RHELPFLIAPVISLGHVVIAHFAPLPAVSDHTAPKGLLVDNRIVWARDDRRARLLEARAMVLRELKERIRHTVGLVPVVAAAGEEDQRADERPVRPSPPCHHPPSFSPSSSQCGGTIRPVEKLLEPFDRRRDRLRYGHQSLPAIRLEIAITRLLFSPPRAHVRSSSGSSSLRRCRRA